MRHPADDEWSAYSADLGRKFLKLDEFLKPTAKPDAVQLSEPKPQVQKTAAATSAPAPKPQPESPSFLRKLFS